MISAYGPFHQRTQTREVLRLPKKDTMTESTTPDQEQLREVVRQRYAASATRVAREHAWAESGLPVR